MKKSLFLAALATIALASCTQNEDFSQPEKINFNPVNYKAQSTKAPINGAYYTSSDPSFGIFAFHTDKGWDTDGTTINPYIGKSEVSWNRTNSEWNTATDAYWPLSGSLTFIGYTPFTSGNADVNAAYDKATKELTITNFSAANQDDLMYTRPSDAQDLTVNSAPYIQEQGGTSTYSGVPIKFRHALSQIVFKAKAADGLAHNTQFKITKIEMKGIKDVATMTVVENGTPQWTDYASMTSKFDKIVYENATGTIVQTGNPSAVSAEIGTGFLMIPQTFSSNLTENIDEFEVTYSMEGSNMPGVWTGPITKSVKIQPQLATVAAGTKYVFTLTISPDRILYSPSIEEDWSVGGSSYDVPEQPAAGN